MTVSTAVLPLPLHTPKASLTQAEVRSLEPVLMGFAYRAVHRADLARDLVQETYVSALEALPGFQGRSALRTWMVGILSRKIIDHYRRTRREVLSDETPEPELGAVFTSSAPLAPDARLDPQKAMRLIDRELKNLPELERMAVLLCDIEQMDREEACNVLHVQPTHLRVLLHRGRTRLRQALEHAGMQGHP